MSIMPESEGFFSKPINLSKKNWDKLMAQDLTALHTAFGELITAHEATNGPAAPAKVKAVRVSAEERMQAMLTASNQSMLETLIKAGVIKVPAQK